MTTTIGTTDGYLIRKNPIPHPTILVRDSGIARGAVSQKLAAGRYRYILPWLLDVPIPILLVIFLLRGCT
ncbi:MAG: hypothetical protein DME45_08365 [Verrucomicrobia bacterium]|nr:MAG: hypothetical protein DME45_08365 [Verrucomicrobiota bacterium]